MKLLRRLVTYYLIWIALTLDFSSFNLIIGFIGVLLTVLIINRFFTDEFSRRKRYKISSVIMFAPYALFIILKSSIDTLRLILSGDTVVKYQKVILKTDSMLYQNVIANTITLTPGTMTVSKEGKRIGVYYLTRQIGDNKVDKSIKKMERKLRRK